jgi:hypothetical protein
MSTQTVKGIAIILVVYVHTAQGMIHPGWWGTPEAYFNGRSNSEILTKIGRTYNVLFDSPSD